RVIPLQRSTDRSVFEFMASSVSSEKPKAAIVRAIAEQMRAARAAGGKILVVGGPAIVHTGAGRHLVRLIELGYVDRLFAGNALAGSIRDDGPLPEVITDVLAAQKAMLAGVEGVSVALMIASALHSIATGNLLPATTKTVCVDINPAVVTKLADRGTFQAIGLV